MPIPWNDDPPDSAERIGRNSAQVLRDVQSNAVSGVPPTVELAQQWHRDLFQGVTLPVAYYAGEFRDSDQRFPELIDYEVQVGGQRCVLARDVPRQLSNLEVAAQAAVSRLDTGIGVNTRPRTTSDLSSVMLLAAQTHGEWVRIHPFANGNGRTARLWANWSLLRYHLPAVVRVLPRPEGERYSRAAADSMLGDHTRMFNLIERSLNERI